jgi:hypothetical protein
MDQNPLDGDFDSFHYKFCVAVYFVSAVFKIVFFAKKQYPF